MKEKLKFFSIIAALVAIVGGIEFLSRPVESFNKELEGKTKMVCYNEVNAREKPGVKSDIVDTKTVGEAVVLTGKVCEYRMDEVHPLWYETTEGYWIVSDALTTPENFRFKFG